jgi:diguanylate cyclase (GGDEF)-like protein
MFRKLIIFRREPEDVYLVLVADLACTVIPTTIMGFTLVMVDLFAWFDTGNAFFPGAAFAGGLASLGKIFLMLVQKRRGLRGETCLKDTVRWESLHTVATAIVAASVGGALLVAFLQPDPNLQVLATALVFGYCSGVVARTAIRPRIANLALILASVPAIFVTAQASDAAHQILAVMLSVFLLGAIETVRHVYKSAAHHISSRLEMATLARNDPLTGLANRLGLREVFRTAAQQRGSIAVHCLDLDGFKAVNDKFGHAGGDAILISVAQRLLALAPSNSAVARFGGDEFVVLQWGVSQVNEAEFLARRIVSALSQPFPLENGVVEIGASLGLSVSSADISLDVLLRLADEASYLIKRDGGGVAIATGSHFSSAPLERFRG